jgi:hypothetical protein
MHALSQSSWSRHSRALVRYEFAANVEQNREAENADQDAANEIALLHTRARDTAEGGLGSNAISIGANAASPLPFRMADGVAYPIEDSGGSHLNAGRLSARLSARLPLERFDKATGVTRALALRAYDRKPRNGQSGGSMGATPPTH